MPAMPTRCFGAHLPPAAAAAATLALFVQVVFPGALAAVISPMRVSPQGRAAGGGRPAAPPPLNTSAPWRAGGGNKAALAATRQQGLPLPPGAASELDLGGTVRVTREEAFEVSVQTGVVYGQGLVCSEAYTECTEKDLLLDLYVPVADGWTDPRPALVLVHGGTEVHGARDTDCNILSAADYFSRRGFVVFAVDYRLESDHGLFPCPKEGCSCVEEVNDDHWYKKPCYMYPAVRDYKAAIRFIRANSQQFNVDDRFIVAGGGSAGATNILLAALADEELYKTELDMQQETEPKDRTLSSTNLEVSSNIRMAVLHWPFAIAVDEAIKAYGSNRFPFKSDASLQKLPAVLHFHGSMDTFAEFSHAQALAGELKGRGMDYKLFVLDGCQHEAWCGTPFQDGRTCGEYIANASLPVVNCECKLPCPLQDIYSFPVIVEKLSLELL